jgi:hypothetical protein
VLMYTQLSDNLYDFRRKSVLVIVSDTVYYMYACDIYQLFLVRKFTFYYFVLFCFALW